MVLDIREWHRTPGVAVVDRRERSDAR